MIEDVLGHGNETCILPGQPEAAAAALTRDHGGLLFTAAELESFADIARDCGEPPWNMADFKTVDI